MGILSFEDFSYKRFRNTLVNDAADKRVPPCDDYEGN